MAALTRDEIISILGPVDDELVTAVVATQATAEQLVQAMAWVNNDEALINDGQPLPSGQVAELVELLSPEVDEEP
ncbi:hypothetical protein [Pseudorhodoplanes sinuspersici]|uniref:Uncharacterized protein n=1 Tax=Pseudorhodoplanes sinuspersici TaxID=1235591 RepID=A0A1W6ZTD7_9HYPH|nr:hypothetical protein [Pseudorhodoplanes sinuspersici]ARQ00566.1 hypothetical protein CAK95_16910 [Pseudorhodoplanes sinuspersici]RKE72162.1 hypothetical protein DFP91_0024 [Pseudorhodoplanes sinuspersici]